MDSLHHEWFIDVFVIGRQRTWHLWRPTRRWGLSLVINDDIRPLFDISKCIFQGIRWRGCSWTLLDARVTIARCCCPCWWNHNRIGNVLVNVFFKRWVVDRWRWWEFELNSNGRTISLEKQTIVFRRQGSAQREPEKCLPISWMDDSWDFYSDDHQCRTVRSVRHDRIWTMDRSRRCAVDHTNPLPWTERYPCVLCRFLPSILSPCSRTNQCSMNDRSQSAISVLLHSGEACYHRQCHSESNLSNSHIPTAQRSIPLE